MLALRGIDLKKWSTEAIGEYELDCHQVQEVVLAPVVDLAEFEILENRQKLKVPVLDLWEALIPF